MLSYLYNSFMNLFTKEEEYVINCRTTDVNDITFLLKTRNIEVRHISHKQDNKSILYIHTKIDLINSNIIFPPNATVSKNL
ncbi:Hypothetical protein ORPV_574 [Orpheovirus IHUMI-LCC2]|uniref:Uncharacterized protein n=1 Tax=Orpheovirus IHUMI-LCC2 TaxID=2023057 RepID=A0A2I2L4L4_9VIRU|nr:Hypothetical protein ORPV_574 [Orpheovirus IHUMI-LCC2]SNW62478.1 Hypothetical protein ORPV_574 [Orpheovirus IHUMI-LCC2]